MNETRPKVSVLKDRAALGDAAGRVAGEALRARLERPGDARVMLAAAPNQQSTLERLRQEEGIDWSRVVAFHMDDYLGLPSGAPQGFGTWLERHFFDHLPQARFERIAVDGAPDVEAVRYATVMGKDPFDLVLLGLGVNGHLAFNDPPADLQAAEAARVVTLDEVSRRQQVDEGHFPELAAVPERAITVTIPRLLHAKRIIASVPGGAKRAAVRDALDAPIHPSKPGTALRTHPDVSMFVDSEAAPPASVDA